MNTTVDHQRRNLIYRCLRQWRRYKNLQGISDALEKLRSSIQDRVPTSAELAYMHRLENERDHLAAKVHGYTPHHR